MPMTYRKVSNCWSEISPRRNSENERLWNGGFRREADLRYTDVFINSAGVYTRPLSAATVLASFILIEVALHQ